MRRFFKKVISLALAAALTVSLVPATDFMGITDNVQAAETLADDDVQITTDIVPDMQLCYALRYIVGGDKYADITVKDLRTYEGDIDLSVFEDYEKIESLDGLGYARKASSIDASKLTRVKQIKDNEFQNCSFTTFGMPVNVVTIGKSAFFNCTNLTYIDLPDTLTTIQSEAFRNCKSLDGVVFPEGIQKIGNNAFAVCESLTSIKIPDGINATIGNSGDDSAVGLGGGVFDGCTGLKQVELGAGMTAIPAAFLAHTSSLRFITIPSKIITIMDSAFSGSGIFSIDLSANTGITTIATSVFDGCVYLSSVKLPKNIETIEEGAFNSCVNLKDFSFITQLTKLKSIGNTAFSYCGFSEVTIPGTVETVGAYAFYHCESLNSATIEDFAAVQQNLVKKIGNYAFSECYYLEDVAMPTVNENNPQVTIEIGQYAFNKCRHLTNINFPANVTKIGDYAFNECGYSITDWKNDDDEFVGTERAMTYYTEPQNIHTEKQSGDMEVILYTDADSRYYQPAVAYINPQKISTSKNVIGDNAITIYIQMSHDDASFEKGRELHYQYIVGIENVDLSACSQLTLGAYAFYKCVNLKKVILPKELQEIPKYAFAECSAPILNGSGRAVSSISEVDINTDWYYGLETVEMGNNVKTIGDYAFYKDYNLVIGGELPLALKTIGVQAFRYCESLTEVILPRSLESIGKYAFSDTSRILSEFMSDKKVLNLDASYANNLQYIGSYAFNKSAIRTFIMDNNAPVTKLDTYTFYDCQYLDTVVLSKNVADISSCALGACLRLKSVNVYDICTFETTSIKGGIDSSKFATDKSTNHGYYLNDKFYLTTPEFNLAITPINDYVTVRKNQETNLPLYSIASDSGGYYSQVKIGDNIYTYNTKTAAFEGEQNTEKINMLPKQIEAVNTVSANDYIKSFSTDTYAVELTGVNEGKNISVNVQEYLQLKISDNTIQVYSPTVTYMVDVTGVPCVGINTDDKDYVSVASAKGVTIAPEFLSDSGDEITDVIEWKILAGADYITMSVAEDGKTATVIPTGNGCANAEIQIKAGQAIKTMFINVVAPASTVTLDTGKTLDMMYGTQAQITATTGYSSKYTDMSQIYPDAVTFESSNEKVVKITKTVDAGGKTVCTLSAVGAGSAVIKAVAAAGSGSASVTVYVSSDHLQLKLSDGNDNQVVTNDSKEIRSKTGVTYTYELNEAMGNEEVIVESSDESVVTATVSKKLKQITFKAVKTGSAKIKIYPAVGTVKNGVTFTINVNSDINAIKMSNKSVPMGSSDSVFTYMTNTFGQNITEANAANFASITDNVIEFTSANPEYVSVDKYGTVTVKKYSEDVKSVIITCSAYNSEGEMIKSSSTTVTPQKPSVKSINITGNSSVYIGSSAIYKLSMVPTEGDYSSIAVSYTTGSKDIASYQLSRDYKTITVTGKAAGTVVLKVDVKKYSAIVATKNIKITVKKPIVKTPSKVKWKKCKGAKKKVSLRWKKVSNATGYEIQMSTKKKSGYKKVKTIASAKKVKCTIKKVKKKTYYFRIRAFVKSPDGSKKYGKWSAKKKIKVK